MLFKKSTFILLLVLSFTLIYQGNVFSSHDEIMETDHEAIQLYSVFDLRNRESFVQVTNTNGSDITIHVQIFNVDDDCNENNFYDTLTPNDTHVYNMRDILTNNGSPSGVILPENAYGSIVITYVLGVGQNSVSNENENKVLFGNFRIVDDNGYEYRTNSAGYTDIDGCGPNIENSIPAIWTFNFNMENGVSLSDIFLLTYDDEGAGEVEISADPLDNWTLFDVDIFDVNENPFSCRNVIYACINQDNPRLEELLELVANVGNASANVASFEYGINNAIPHSKNGELLCPGNTINEGIVRLDHLADSVDINAGFVGLNNGNGRGSMDAFFSVSCTLPENDPT